MKLVFCLFAMCFSASVFAQQDCGLVNGETYCTMPSGCGYVNGHYTCSSSSGCGYVNGIYGCFGESGFEPTPVTSGSQNEFSKPSPYDAGIKDGLQWLSGWFNSWEEGDTGILGRFGQWLIAKLVSAWLEMKLEALNFAWMIAKGVLENMHVFTNLQSAWSGLGADVLAVLNFFGIPTACNILLTAGTTRFLLSFMPGW